MSSPQHITAEAIQAYCWLLGINHEEDIALFIRMTTVLDNAWMEDWAKKEKARQNSSKSTSGRRL